MKQVLAAIERVAAHWAIGPAATLAFAEADFSAYRRSGATAATTDP